MRKKKLAVLASAAGMAICANMMLPAFTSKIGREYTGPAARCSYADTQGTSPSAAPLDTSDTDAPAIILSELDYETDGWEIESEITMPEGFSPEKTPEIKPKSTGKTGKTVLTALGGTCNGPSGKETWYNLPMDWIVQSMRRKGYSEEEYPYWIREDGVKMFGDYVMVAANLSLRPKGTILPCSMGMAIVVDTGPFAKVNTTQLDVATNW